MDFQALEPGRERGFTDTPTNLIEDPRTLLGFERRKCQSAPGFRFQGEVQAVPCEHTLETTAEQSRARPLARNSERHDATTIRDFDAPDAARSDAEKAGLTKGREGALRTRISANLEGEPPRKSAPLELASGTRSTTRTVDTHRFCPPFFQQGRGDIRGDRRSAILCTEGPDDKRASQVRRNSCPHRKYRYNPRRAHPHEVDDSGREVPFAARSSQRTPCAIALSSTDSSTEFLTEFLTEESVNEEDTYGEVAEWSKAPAC